ncbi:hypothetical protein GGQ74_000083 [Desulfobaculum xiamenense]|uniref:Peptidase M15A C-terminal domain-containing protein n=1 Tax=Desulfobaculum xiamenense TaxID=995050 RepID=A0A846QJU5_9BACT|nr:D-Ala-D-Ala carboxypeptidase family metallohydrolase [Desulfobaculum xiamenense]NJB66443.1 hypothetical protein [Desulfobaculum xiamenense]
MKEFFADSELACTCCGLVHMHPETRARLNVARELAGIPFILTSACRCERHNAEVGGAQDSAHLASSTREAHAVDIRVRNSRERFLVLGGLIAAGFTRIGVAKDFIHADDDPDKDPRVAWLYPARGRA